MNIASAFKHLNFNSYLLLDSIFCVRCWASNLVSIYLAAQELCKIIQVIQASCSQLYASGTTLKAFQEQVALTYSRQDKDSTWAYSQCPLGEFSPQTHQPPRGSLHPWAPVTSPLPSHLKELSPAPNALKRRVCAAQRPSRSSTAQRPPRNCSVGPLLHRPLVCAVQSPWKLRT